MKAISYIILYSFIAILMLGCDNQVTKSENHETEDWKASLKEKLPELGHRNWILIVDKAFPLQNSDGIITINTGENLPDVLTYTLNEIDKSTHVKPIVYTDKELYFITSDQVNQIDDYRNTLDKLIGQYDPQVMLHDSVFVKIDEASKLFKILILKTEEVIAYSSVFIQLDCKYWSNEKENGLRRVMNND